MAATLAASLNPPKNELHSSTFSPPIAGIHRRAVAWLRNPLFAAVEGGGSSGPWTAGSSNDWNTGFNWSGNTVPTVTASFGTSTVTSVTISLNSTVNNIVFNPGYQRAFNIGFALPTDPVLTINGAGITNNSGITVNFVTGNISGNVSGFIFTGTATAGSNTVFTNNGATTSGASGGFTEFEGNSTAGSATLIANGGSNGGQGGGIYFADSIQRRHGKCHRQRQWISRYQQRRLSPRGVTVGSIEGGGNVSSREKTNLTVGSNNLSTIFFRRDSGWRG